VSRHDYPPFGEELYAGTGTRSAAWGYTGDSTRQHFTGYEADAETGLNFAQARYQSPVQGRFTSVDPLGMSASVLNPQSFNRYSYVLNNPVNMTDPSGMMGMMPDASMSWDTISDAWANENNFARAGKGSGLRFAILNFWQRTLLAVCSLKPVTKPRLPASVNRQTVR